MTPAAPALLDRLLLVLLVAALALAGLCRLAPALHGLAPAALAAAVALLALRLLRGAALARAGRQPWPRLLLPALLLVEGGAGLLWPGARGSALKAATAGVLEVLLLALAWRAWRAGGSGSGGLPEVRLAEHLALFLPPAAARAAALELVLLGSAGALLAGRSRLPGDGFSYHRESALGAFLPALPLLLPAELLLVEVLLRSTAPWLRWTIHGLDLYGLLWLLGFWHTVRTRPHRLAGDVLHLHTGLLSRLEVPRSALQGELPLPGGMAEGGREALLKGVPRLGLKGGPEVVLALDPPATPWGVLGAGPPAARVRVGVDDPAAFRAALGLARP